MNDHATAVTSLDPGSLQEHAGQFVLPHEASEPVWVEGLAAGLVLAKQLSRPLAVKPTGQGYGRCDDW